MNFPETKLPTPKFEVGQKVQLVGDRKWWRRKLLRHVIKHWRLGKKTLSKTNKAKALVRECMKVFDEATTAEIAGIRPEYGHPIDYPEMNACYLADIPGASNGITFAYHLCFRYIRNGNNLAMVTGCAVASDADLAPLEE
jgi:hypothetical protein